MRPILPFAGAHCQSAVAAPRRAAARPWPGGRRLSAERHPWVCDRAEGQRRHAHARDPRGPPGTPRRGHRPGGGHHRSRVARPARPCAGRPAHRGRRFDRRRHAGEPVADFRDTAPPRPMTGTRRSRLLALVALAMLAATPAIAATPTTVRVHGTETWTPTMEVALDEVAMRWAGEPRGANTPPTLVDGTSVLRAGREAAAIRLTGVTTVADLVTRARALRDANPQWETRLVLYASGETRNARSRRLLTEEVAVVAEDGTVTREHVTDPLTTLQVAETIAARGGVQRVEPVAQASDYLQARLTRKVAKLKRQDQPSERQEFFALKRVPPGESGIPVERYLQAREQMKGMPLHSTAGGAVRHPSAAELGINFDTAAAFLGPWTPLGPGNIGGRTRALVVDPANPNTLYAGGVAGGVWKTTNGGGAWVALTDTLLPNLAVPSLDTDPTSSNILYAGTGEGVSNGDAVRGAGISKTTDGGVTWNQLATTANPAC